MDEDGVKAERQPQHPTCGTMVAGATVVTHTHTHTEVDGFMTMSVTELMTLANGLEAVCGKDGRI